MRYRKRGEGCITQRKDGRWQASCRIGNTRKYVYGKTCDEASKKLRAILNAQDAGERIVTPSRMTMATLLARWIDYQRTRVRANTLQSYQKVIDYYIKHQIGSIKLTALTPYDVEHCLSLIHLSPRSVRYARQVIFMALKKAVHWELVRRNVADTIKGPKRSKPDIHPLNDDELAAFVKILNSGTIVPKVGTPLFLMAVSIGLRKGELLGLKWTDIIDGSITIRRTLQPLGEFDPKTESSRRTILLPAAVSVALDKWRILQLEMRMKAGDRWMDGGYIFTTTIGTALDQRNVSRWLDAILGKVGITHRRFHDLRHTCATQLLRHGARLDDVSKLLGHSSKAMTLDVYSHAIGNGSEVASLMDTIIG